MEVARVGECGGLLVGNPGVGSGSFARLSGGLRHSRGVSLEERDVVLQHEELIDLESPTGCASQGILSLVEAAEIGVVDGEVVVSHREIGIKLDSLSSRCDCLFVATFAFAGETRQHGEGDRIARIRSRPGLAGLSCLFEIPRSQNLIIGVDEELLAVTGMFPQLPGPGGALQGKTKLIQIGVFTSQG